MSGSEIAQLIAAILIPFMSIAGAQMMIEKREKKRQAREVFREILTHAAEYLNSTVSCCVWFQRLSSDASAKEKFLTAVNATTDKTVALTADIQVINMLLGERQCKELSKTILKSLSVGQCASSCIMLESEIIESGFLPVETLLADLGRFESWSRICLEALFGGQK